MLDELLQLRELDALRRSVTVSRSGHRVAAMRRRRSTSCSSGMSTRKGRMASPSAASSAPARSMFNAPAAAETARRSRRFRWMMLPTRSSPPLEGRLSNPNLRDHMFATDGRRIRIRGSASSDFGRQRDGLREFQRPVRSGRARAQAHLLSGVGVRSLAIGSVGPPRKSACQKVSVPEAEMLTRGWAGCPSLERKSCAFPGSSQRRLLERKADADVLERGSRTIGACRAQRVCIRP